MPNDVHVIIGIPGKAGGNKIKRVHINSCKPYNQVQACRVAAWARKDEIVYSVAKKLEGDVLTNYRQKELDAVLQKWGDVLSDIPGKTDIRMIYVQVILFQLDLFHTKSQVNGGHRSRKSLKRCKSRAFSDHQLVHGVHLSCLFQKRVVKLGCVVIFVS